MNNLSRLDIQEVIGSIWKKMLNLDEVSDHQTFFDLGGDSLSMIDMLLDVSKNLGIEVDPSLLFQDASLSGFSALVEAKSGAEIVGQEGVV